MADAVNLAIVIDSLRRQGVFIILKRSRNLAEKYRILNKVIPDFSFWPAMAARKLIFIIERDFGIEMGVCPHYHIVGSKQYCSFSGKLFECTCSIPQPHCVWRDMKAC